jgi:hypothetical protein
MDSGSTVGRSGSARTGPGTNPPQGGATAADVGREARDAAGEVVEEVQRQASQRLQQQVESASERLGGLSRALTSVSHQLHEQNDAMTADWVDRAADQIDRFSGYLRGKDVDQLVEEGERFARRQPALFLGGSFVLGLLAARFLKSSSASSDRGSYRGGYGSPGYGGMRRGDGYGTYQPPTRPSAVTPTGSPPSHGTSGAGGASSGTSGASMGGPRVGGAPTAGTGMGASGGSTSGGGAPGGSSTQSPAGGSTPGGSPSSGGAGAGGSGAAGAAGSTGWGGGTGGRGGQTPGR